MLSKILTIFCCISIPGTSISNSPICAKLRFGCADCDTPEFTDLISAFQVCYQNGGKFASILEVYSKQMSSALMLEEREKEKSMSSIITLCVMLALNIFLVISYVFGNKEFAGIIRESISGHIVMDFNAISSIVCVYLLFRMYKLEG